MVNIVIYSLLISYLVIYYLVRWATADGKTMQISVETVPQGPVSWFLHLLGAEQAAVM